MCGLRSPLGHQACIPVALQQNMSLSCMHVTDHREEVHNSSLTANELVAEELWILDLLLSPCVRQLQRLVRQIQRLPEVLQPPHIYTHMHDQASPQYLRCLTTLTKRSSKDRHGPCFHVASHSLPAIQRWLLCATIEQHLPPQISSWTHAVNTQEHSNARLPG